MNPVKFISPALLILVVASHLQAQTDADALAKQLQNPVANLISVPFQGNFDYGIGANDGSRMVLNIQPVIPLSISNDWNLITRTIVPIISQKDVFGESGSQTGLGDILFTAFFSPKEPTKGGIIWGVGPALLFPTSTEELLGGDDFGAGPSAVLLTQKGNVTLGGLVNHVWADGLSNTFINPFVARNFSGGKALTLNTEMTQNWTNDAFYGVIMLQASKVFTIGNQAVNAGLAPRIHFGADRTADWGFRALVVLLFPK